MRLFSAPIIRNARQSSIFDGNDMPRSFRYPHRKKPAIPTGQRTALNGSKSTIANSLKKNEPRQKIESATKRSHSTRPMGLAVFISTASILRKSAVYKPLRRSSARFLLCFGLNRTNRKTKLTVHGGGQYRRNHDRGQGQSAHHRLATGRNVSRTYGPYTG